MTMHYAKIPLIDRDETSSYPPDGSTRYHTPKPLRSTINNGKNKAFQDAFQECQYQYLDEPRCTDIYILKIWCLSSFCCKPKFWRLVFFAVFIASVCHFFATVTLKKPARTSFLYSPRREHKILSYLNDNRLKTTVLSNQKNPNFSPPNAKESKNLTGERLSMPLLGLKQVLNSSVAVHNSLPVVGSRESSAINQSREDYLKLCPPIPPNLSGKVPTFLKDVPSLEIQETLHLELLPGGHFVPKECRSRHKVAIIVPFRDRRAHLEIFMRNIHGFLQKQQIDYTIFIVEQAGKNKFNRGMLMNVGSIEASKMYPFDCYIFHDVDLIPEDDRNLYTCPEQPRHMSVAINNMQYKLPYNDIFGGVSAMTVTQFKTVNGFSNCFWGWGGEDDDMSNRIKFANFYVSRYPANIARYTMISHKKDMPNPLRFKYLNAGRTRFRTDGLSNMSYKVLEIKLERLYTLINVELSKGQGPCR